VSLKNQAVAGAFWAGAANWVSQGISLLIFTLLARLLAPEDFGLIAMAGVYIAFTQVFVNFGFSEALIQRENLERKHLDTAFWAGVALSLVMAFLTIGLAPVVAGFFGEDDLTGVVLALALTFPLSGLATVQQAVLSRAFRFRELGLRKIGSTLAGGVAGVWLALSGYGVWSLVAQSLITALVGVMVLWGASSWRPSFAVSATALRELMPFSVNMLGIQILGFVNRRLDQLLIGYFLGATALGYYSLARRIFQVITQLLLEPFAKLALPTFSRLQHDRERLTNAFYRATRVAGAVSSPAFLGVILIAPDLVPVVFGEKWRASIPVLQFLCGVGILYGLTFFVVPAILALGKARAGTAIQVVNTFGNVVAILIAIPWGLVAVAAAFLLRAVVTMPIGLWLARKYMGLRLRQMVRGWLGTVGGLACMAMVVGVVELLARDYAEAVRLALAISAGTVTYLAVLYLLGGAIFQELASLRKR
jgi:PST family polysaccharide transporter